MLCNLFFFFFFKLCRVFVVARGIFGIFHCGVGSSSCGTQAWLPCGMWDLVSDQNQTYALHCKADSNRLTIFLFKWYTFLYFWLCWVCACCPAQAFQSRG